MNLIGRTISHYRILEKLGEGGMGVVYKAEDTRLRRTVALKFLRSEAFADAEQKARFIREAQTAAMLDHPNIGTVYGIEEVDEGLFIAMAFIEGIELKEILQNGPMDIDETVRIATAAAKGLQAAHQKAIVHRDIKSSNIIVSEEGRVKILDFGLAKVTGGMEISKTTRGVGTPVYMSPEQARGDEVDHRTDIWSLGVCLYEMLTGVRPFRGDFEPAVVYSILNEDPAPIAELRPGVSEGFQHILDKMLCKCVDCRYDDVSELISDLQVPERAVSVQADGSPQTGVQPSVAVLPFSDMSPAKDQEYFCEGIAEEIINKLAAVVGLRVTARTSAFAFKGKAQDIREIGRKLGVTAVLEGSVRKAGNRIRVTGQLINASDGYHLWSQRYDRDLEDVFGVQDDIAGRIVDAMSITLSDKERVRLTRPRSRDVEAYDFYLRGRQYFHRVNHRDIAVAVDMFERAIEKDPDFALAYAGLADCHSYLREFFGRGESYMTLAMENSDRAVELDPELAEAHASRGLALAITQRHEDARKEFETAIRLNPQLFEAYFFFARMCFVMREFESAAAMFEKAELANPADYQTPVLLAQTYRALGQTDKERDALQRAMEITQRQLDQRPEDTRAMYMMSAVHFMMGDQETAMTWAQRVLTVDPDDPGVLYFMACLYSNMGETDESLSFLEKAVSAGFSHKEWLLVDPDMVPLHDHPRFKAVIDGIS